MVRPKFYLTDFKLVILKMKNKFAFIKKTILYLQTINNEIFSMKRLQNIMCATRTSNWSVAVRIEGGDKINEALDDCVRW